MLAITPATKVPWPSPVVARGKKHKERISYVGGSTMLQLHAQPKLYPAPTIVQGVLVSPVGSLLHVLKVGMLLA